MTTVVPTRRLLLIPEVADRLRVSVRTVCPLIETGELPAVRLGAKRHAIRVAERELEAWLEESRVNLAGRGPPDETAPAVEARPVAGSERRENES
jgi:excisionase family DNA binding protein